MSIRCKQIVLRGVLLTVLSISPLLLSGCEMYDWLVDQIQTAVSPAASYHVSVIDCKTIPAPGSLIVFDSTLAARLSASIREGVHELKNLPKFRNITLVDRVPQMIFSRFHDDFFSKASDPAQRTKLLREYCDKYQSNILMWGAAMGDDYEIVFIGYLYRRDLNVISETVPLKMTEKMSERVQEKLVMDATTTLLKKSLDGTPIGEDGRLAETLRENKALILFLGEILWIAMQEEQ